MKINCLLVDDEKEAINVLDHYLDKLDEFTVSGKANNAIEAFQILQSEHIDLMFLDIKMPRLNGIDFLKSLNNPPKVIITTAYREFALDGFEMDVVDFLLKPISMERFLKSISKVYSLTHQEKLPQLSSSGSTNHRPFIYVKADRKMIKVFLDEICYIESIKDYVKIYLESGVIMTKQRISFMEEILPEGAFIRVHRSFIISFEKITAFTPSFIEIRDNSIPIGNMYKDSLQRILDIH